MQTRSESEPRSDHTAIDELPSGYQIGNFRILSTVGRGGMGVVYKAEQVHPVNREVALKLIRGDLSSKSVRARFEAERQALAMMNHPGIATVYEAGTTPGGMPFLAMEFIEGTPITDFCDQNHMKTKDRIQLFLKVCEAVQHAHQKMVIHRDLKPSNVLVIEREGAPQPKIIDFGIAKGSEKPLVDRTGHPTIEHGPIGTPMYMSPEQIEGSGQDIDARVDVYALGVMLYELLVGALPFDKKMDYYHLMVKILEEDPPTPSTRLTSMGKTEIDVTSNRGTDKRKLRKLLRGDLDWIILKAIHKNRDKRYNSPTELKIDLAHFLRNEPVSARPPELSYRMRKFIGRNKTAVALAIIVVLSLFLGIAGTTIGMLRAVEAKEEALEAERKARSTADYLEKVLKTVDPNVDGRQVRVIDLLGKASQIIGEDLQGQPEIEARVRKTIGWTFLELGLYRDAEKELRKTVELQSEVLGAEHPETLNSLNALARLLYKKGLYKEAEKMHREILAKEERIQGETHPNTQWTMYNLAKSLEKQGKYDEAELLFRRNLQIRERTLGPHHPHTLVTINSLSMILGKSGDLTEAKNLLVRNIEYLEAGQGPRHLDTLIARANLVNINNRLGHYQEAMIQADALLEIQEEALGADHPETMGTSYQKAYALSRLGIFDQAVYLLKDTLFRQKEALGSGHLETLKSQIELGIALHRQGKHQEAEAHLWSVIQQNREQSVLEENDILEAQLFYGSVLVKLGRFRQAEDWLLAVAEGSHEKYPRIYELCLSKLTELYRAWDKPDEAEKYRLLAEEHTR